MWPFDQLRRLFGGGASGSKAATSGSIEDQLAEFVNQEQRRPDDREAAPEKTGSREKIQAARSTVETIHRAFRSYVTEKVLRRFGNDFKLETPNLAQTRDLDLMFGDAKTGNEYRYAKVAFKDKFAVVLRAQAMILSRDVQLKTLFLELRSTRPHHTQELDLSSFDSIAEVNWDTVYDQVFLEFLTWHRTLSAKQD